MFTKNRKTKKDSCVVKSCTVSYDTQYYSYTYPIHTYPIYCNITLRRAGEVAGVVVMPSVVMSLGPYGWLTCLPEADPISGKVFY